MKFHLLWDVFHIFCRLPKKLFAIQTSCDLAGEKTNQVFRAWSTSVKLAWGCPQQTRTYCCGFNSARVDILSRFVKFFNSLRQSASYEVQVLARLVARDVQSVNGKNLSLIGEITNLNPLASSKQL